MPSSDLCHISHCDCMVIVNGDCECMVIVNGDCECMVIVKVVVVAAGRYQDRCAVLCARTPSSSSSVIDLQWPTNVRQTNVPKISYETTLWHLVKIQSHLSSHPHSQWLKDKVCIMTGSGSLTGIGYVLCPFIISRSGCQNTLFPAQGTSE